MSITARGTIQGALKLIGVIDPLETVSPEDAADGLIMLNDLVDLLAIDGHSLYATTNVSATFSGASATVGPSGVFNVPLPPKINHAFYRKGNADYHLELLTDKRYDEIFYKSQAADYPLALWHQRGLPLATVTLWPVPTTITLYLNLDTQITAFADLDTAYDFAQGYRSFLKYRLTEYMAPLFQRQVPPGVMKVLASVNAAMKRSNFVMPELDVETWETGVGKRIAHAADYAAFFSGL